VQSELSVRLINRMKELLHKFHLHTYDEQRHSGWIRHVWVRTTRNNQAMLVLVTRTDDFPHEREVLESLVREFPELVGIHQNINPGKTNVILGRNWRKLCGADGLEERLGELRFMLSPGSFYQVNSLQTEVLYNKVKELAGRGEGLLDIYCGIGAMALWLAGQFEQVVGVDEIKKSIFDAEQNARLNRIKNTHFIAESAEAFLPGFRHPNPSRDLTVILDPPRSGCHPNVLQSLIRLKPHKLLYVSCDPGTLARDLNILSRGGYSPRFVQPVDLFPHTAHIETITLLTFN
jgi:23S rRNA (uracil1939-C5)-methyltransferase